MARRRGHRFWWTFGQILVRPRRAITAIDADPRARDGVAVTALFGGLYSIAALTSYAIGREPKGRLLTFIPSRRYYLYESCFCVPLSLLWMGLFAGTTRRLCRRVGGGGTFEADLAALAFSQTVPMIALFWAPDMTCYLLRVPEVRYQRLVPVYGAAAMMWAVGLSVAFIATTERLDWRTVLPLVILSDVASAVGSGVAVAMR